MDNPPLDWSLSLAELKSRLGTEVVDRWLEPLRVASATADQLVLYAPNQFFRDWVASHYLEAIAACAGNRQVQMIVAPTGLAEAVAQAVGSLKAARETAHPPPAGAAAGEQSLNARFTFDEFVVGPSNRFAHAASLAVAESPARAYNPLCIYGGVGLGKTHLMQAIGHAVIARWPERRIVYRSSEGFTNDLITAIQTKTTGRFRDRYRTVDVLLVDDIHFIAGKEATQEEFFHTFNALYDAHKQIVISTDRPPKDIAGLEERLVSRFEWGLVTDIQPPDLETRIAILRKKAEDARVEVSPDVVDFIARQITSNIRELEGALIRVLAYCQFFGHPQTAATAQEVLRDMVREVSARVTLDGVQQRVAAHFQVTVQELRGARRHRSILLPRQVAMYLCRRLTEASLPEIGRAFGGRDHTTVIHAVNKVERDLTQDLHRKRLVEQLEVVILGEAHPAAGLSLSTFPHPQP